MPETDNADLVEIACVQGPFEADLIKNFLESHGIASIVRGRTAPFVYPLTVDGMAEFKIFVQAADARKSPRPRHGDAFARRRRGVRKPGLRPLRPPPPQPLVSRP